MFTTKKGLELIIILGMVILYWNIPQITQSEMIKYKNKQYNVKIKINRAHRSKLNLLARYNIQIKCADMQRSRLKYILRCAVSLSIFYALIWNALSRISFCLAYMEWAQLKYISLCWCGTVSVKLHVAVLIWVIIVHSFYKQRDWPNVLNEPLNVHLMMLLLTSVRGLSSETSDSDV